VPRPTLLDVRDAACSHGGLGALQSDALLMHPSDWPVDAELIGAPAVHGQLLAWREQDRAPVDAFSC